MCKGVLDYNTKLEAYYCSSCVQWYDTRIQDVPLKDIKDFQLVPYGEQRHYPQFDANDPMTPFVEAVNLDDNANENMEGVEIRSYDQGRIQHINIHNVTFADAIKYSNVLSAQKKGEELD
jgi:hypothetical protein